jgi:hypothetical protein
MQKPEHIERLYQLIPDMVKSNSQVNMEYWPVNMEYWLGARDLLAWVLEDPVELFDPRLLRRIAELSNHAIEEAHK